VSDELSEAEPLTVEFSGESFAIADKIGLMPLMRFAKTAKAGADSEDLEGLVAMYDLLEQVIDPADWDRFVNVASRDRVDGETLMSVVGKAIKAMTGRPTQRSSDSSDGPTSIPGNSAGDSSSQVVARLEEQGRPDLALVVEMARSA
jgi:hypothetical protein